MSFNQGIKIYHNLSSDTPSKMFCSTATILGKQVQSLVGFEGNFAGAIITLQIKKPDDSGWLSSADQFTEPDIIMTPIMANTIFRFIATNSTANTLINAYGWGITEYNN